MTRTGRAASILIILTFACVAVAGFPQGSFKPPQVVSVTDAYIPYRVVFDGFVILEVFLDGDGTLVETKAMRDPGTMLPAAVAAVKTWKFRPAEMSGRTLPSAMTTVFVYRPANNGPAGTEPPKDFRPVRPEPPPRSEGAPDYTPAGIVSVSYPDYPVNSVAWGSVVIQATVDASGVAENPLVLRGDAPFRELAIDALKKWRFEPAKSQGKAVPSQLAIAFTFQTPSS